MMGQKLLALLNGISDDFDLLVWCIFAFPKPNRKVSFYRGQYVAEVLRIRTVLAFCISQF